MKTLQDDTQSPPDDSQHRCDSHLRLLLAKIAAREMEAYRELHDRCSGPLSAHAIGMMRDRQAAEDVFQDAMIKVWQKADRYDSEKGSAIGWLFTIVRNTARDHMRKSTRLSKIRPEVINHFEVAAYTGSPDGASDALEKKETALILDEAIGRLPAIEREAIRLKFFGELSHTELAAALQIPLGTIKSRIRRSLKKLQALTPSRSPSHRLKTP